MDAKKDIFICHASEDKPQVVRPLYDCLESAGFNIWYDEAEINWGDSITQKVNWGLIHSRYVIVVLSESFLDKKWPNREFQAVMNLESSTGEVKILPLVVGAPGPIMARYPLVNDKKYLSWTGEPDSVVGELLRMMPQRTVGRPTAYAGNSNTRKPDGPVDLPDSDVDVSVQVVHLSHSDEIHGYLLKLASVGNVPISSSLDELGQPNLVATLMFRYLDACLWHLCHRNATGVKIIIELPGVITAHAGLLSFFTTLVVDSGIRLGDVVILLPEDILSKNFDQGILLSSALEEKGISVGVSRFGTGYSSLSYLKDISPQYILVDDSFLESNLSDPDDIAILRAIQQLASSLGCLSGVEGVSTDLHHEILQSMGYRLLASPI